MMESLPYEKAEAFPGLGHHWIMHKCGKPGYEYN